MTRGFTETEMARVAGLVDDVLTKRYEGTIARVKRQVREFDSTVAAVTLAVDLGGLTCLKTGEILR